MHFERKAKQSWLTPAKFEEIEEWLDRFLDLRQSGWSRGLFSMDAHLKNFGVCGDRVVLLDTGGLTNRWTEIMDTLAYEEGVTEPHSRLGLGDVLEDRPDIAARFNARWKSHCQFCGGSRPLAYTPGKR